MPEATPPNNSANKPARNIFVLNAGSSSFKSAVYRVELDAVALGAPPEAIWSAQLDWPRAGKKSELTVRSGGRESRLESAITDHRAALQELFLTLWGKSESVLASPSDISAVGHRIVHGGTQYRQSVLLTEAIERDLAGLTEFAPLHVPANLEAIRIAEQILGKTIPQIAVFDTAFHSSLPDASAAYPLPYEWYQKGVRRYGFHGISHCYASRRTAELLGKVPNDFQMVSCHLGSGCSLCAVKNGISVDTTMGFTPLAGLMMGTRSGSVDPGALLYLQRHANLGAVELERLLNQESGLLGISGISGDMRDVLKAKHEGNARAELAFEMFVHIAASNIGKMAASLDRLDAISFTGGMGEHSAEVRAAICRRLAIFHAELDAGLNEQSPADAKISAESSAVPVLVIKANEEWEIVRECSTLLATSS